MPFEHGNTFTPPIGQRGRVKGQPNRINGEVKEMILKALTRVGGYRYLMKQAEQNPVAFMALVGKVLPLQVTGANGGPILTRVIHELTDEDGPHRLETITIETTALSPRTESESALSPDEKIAVTVDRSEAKVPPID